MQTRTLRCWLSARCLSLKRSSSAAQRFEASAPLRSSDSVFKASAASSSSRNSVRQRPASPARAVASSCNWRASTRRARAASSCTARMLQRAAWASVRLLRGVWRSSSAAATSDINSPWSLANASLSHFTFASSRSPRSRLASLAVKRRLRSSRFARTSASCLRRFSVSASCCARSRRSASRSPARGALRDPRKRPRSSSSARALRRRASALSAERAASKRAQSSFRSRATAASRSSSALASAGSLVVEDDDDPPAQKRRPTSAAAPNFPATSASNAERLANRRSTWSLKSERARLSLSPGSGGMPAFALALATRFLGALSAWSRTNATLDCSSVLMRISSLTSRRKSSTSSSRTSGLPHQVAVPWSQFSAAAAQLAPGSRAKNGMAA
mmetsp:Transcript_88825/g.250209  ORF Transcript_88825/g.250209 Transcript_88825/m.250209 type:complete len:388 (+) Transcript_88825:451-1614(+)